jgi:hypothetical protein
MNLLSSLGLPHAVIHDDDNDKDEHKEFNQLIEDSRHATLTLNVKRISGDLETMLGVSSPRSNHRKPQHVLYQYDTGNIEDAKMQSFCTLVEACLPEKPSAGPRMGPPNVGA